MEKLKKVIGQHGEWDFLLIYVERIESQISTDFSQSLENAKALLETIAKKICGSKNTEIDLSISVNALLKKAFTVIGYNNSSLVTQISSALATIGQQMGNLRNDIGITSHGKTKEEVEKRNSKVDDITKEFLIDTTVLVASFLIRAYESENPRVKPGNIIKILSHDDNPEFNDYLNDAFGGFIMEEYYYSASEILYYVDNEAYIAELKEYSESGQ